MALFEQIILHILDTEVILHDFDSEILLRCGCLALQKIKVVVLDNLDGNSVQKLKFLGGLDRSLNLIGLDLG